MTDMIVKDECSEFYTLKHPITGEEVKAYKIDKVHLVKKKSKSK